MKKLSLSTLIGGMSSLALVGLLVIALVFFNSMAELNISIEKSNTLNTVEDKIVLSAVQADRARMVELVFARTPLPSHAVDHDADFTKAIAALDDAAMLAKADAGLASLGTSLTTARQEARQIQDMFKTVFERQKLLGFDEKTGLQGKFRADVHTVETALNTLDDNSLSVQMLMMRRHEKDFLLRLDRKYLELQKKAAADFKKALSVAKLGSLPLAAYQAPMDAYHASFAQYLEEKLVLEKNYGDLTKLNDAMSATMRDIRGKIEKDALKARSDAAIALARFSLVMWSCIITLILAMVAAGFVIMQAIRSPINRLNASMAALADGRLATEIADVDRKDEIGTMAASLQHFRNALVEKSKTDAAIFEESRQKLRRSHQLDELFLTFEADMSEMSQTMASSSEEMSGTANSLLEIAEQTSGLSASVAASTAQSSSSVHLIATASEELAVSIDQIASSLSQSVHDSALALQDAQAADTCAKSLSDGVNSISSILDVIETLVSQTNLLALNATIEAARAGEAGRGFAVVAQEVKLLAAQTASAAQEINSRIEAIRSESNTSVRAVASVNEKMNGIANALTEIGFAVDEQRRSTQEISQRVQDISAGARDASAQIADVDSGAAITRESARQMHTASQLIARQSAVANGKIAEFVKAARHA